MPEFPTLAQVLAPHADYVSNLARHCSCGKWHDHGLTAPISRLPFSKHQADVWREACTIRTADQLNSLRANPAHCEGPIVKDSDGDVFEANDDGSWCEMGDYRRVTPQLPALLLWHPEWSKQ